MTLVKFLPAFIAADFSVPTNIFDYNADFFTNKMYIRLLSNLSSRSSDENDVEKC